MIDHKFIGLDLGSHQVEIEKGRLKFFAQAVGQTNPVYFDEAAAKAAGHPNLPVPPTYFFSADLNQPNPFEYLNTMEINLGRMLHGTQDFKYHKPVYAGEKVILSGKITDISEKKGGALSFAVKEVSITNQAGELVATMTITLVVRN